MTHRSAGLFIGLLCILLPAAASAQTALRMTAYSYWSEYGPAGYGPDDSTSVSYASATNALPIEVVDYNYTGAGYELYYRSLRSYTSFGRDSLLRFESWNNASSAFVKDRIRTSQYDWTGNPISVLDQVWDAGSNAYVNSVRAIHTYNSAGKLLSIRSEIWKPATSTWLKTMETLNTLDAANRETTIVHRYWNSVSGNLTGGDSLLLLYHGNMTDHARNIGYEFNPNTAAYALAYKDTIWFDAAGRDTAAYYLNYNPVTTSWDTGSKALMTRSTVPAGFETVRTYLQLNASLHTFSPVSRYTNLENTAGQPLVLFFEEYAASVPHPSRKYTYYYEAYTPSGVASPAQEAALLLSPNPASRTLTAKLQWSAPQAFTATVTDMLGRTCIRIAGTTQGQQELNIPVEALGEGNYILSVQGSDGASTAKPFTVKH